MDWKKQYSEKCISAVQAAELIKSRDRVAVSNACGSPEYILDEIVKRADELRDVEIVHMVSMGNSDYCLADYQQSFRHISLFAGEKSRECIYTGRGDYLPCFYSEIPELFREKKLSLDVALITVSEPNSEGNFSLGVSVDYTLQAAISANLVIAEVTPFMPTTSGKSFIHARDIDYFVPSQRKMIELPLPKIGATEQAIGSHIAGLINNGDCLQLGIGAIPDAVLTFLGEKRDLGIHSEMISDGVMELVEKGVINCSQKTLHPGKIVITFAMGSQNFYRWLHKNPLIEMYPVDYVNDPFVISKNDHMVSINSAIAVDLMGQVAADMMGPFQYSGVGGQVDFVRGVRRSKKGRSIIALPATAKGGEISRIVSTMEKGQAVTTSRSDVDTIVTEFGVATLRGKTVAERAKALISIAAPEFRGSLEKQFQSIYKK